MLTPSSSIVATVVVAVSLLTVSWDEAVGGSESLGMDSQTRQIYDECTAQLMMIPTTIELSREGFASLVGQLSHGELQGSYEQLTLQYSSLFNLHACRNRRGCIGNRANISISGQDEQAFTCFTLASLLSESIDLEVDD